MRGWPRHWPWRRHLGLVLALSVIAGAGWLAGREPVRWHWGASGTATLGEASKRLVARLERPVQLTVAVPEGHMLRRHARRLAAAYRRAHPDFELTLLDPKGDADRARDLGLVRTGEALVEYGERAERIATPSEARLSAALERLLRRGQRFIAFLTGHGERDLLGSANYALGDFGSALERKGYQLQPLSMAQTSRVPDNTSLVVVADPRRSLQARAQAALRRYLRNGGAVLWLGEPDGPSPQPVLPAALAAEPASDPEAGGRLGIEDDRFLLLEQPGEHPAASGLQAPVLLVDATGVQARDATGWGHRVLLARPPRLRGGGAGQPLALTLEHEGGARAAVIGDADLLANTYLGNGANLPFGLQIVDWLAQAESFMGTYVSPAPDQRLALDQRLGLLLAGFLLAGLPLLLTVVAVWRWRRLRHE